MAETAVGFKDQGNEEYKAGTSFDLHAVEN